jgi:hypothetical protein
LNYYLKNAKLEIRKPINELVQVLDQVNYTFCSVFSKSDGFRMRSKGEFSLARHLMDFSIDAYGLKIAAAP